MSFAIRSRRARALALATLSVLPTLAHATSTSWTFNGSGSWTQASNWSNGVPVGGSDVFIGKNTITYDYAGASIQFNSVKIDNTSTGSFATSVKFSQSANTFNSLSETIGDAGHGLWTLSGGTHNVTTTNSSLGLAFGSLAGSSGVGTMSAGALTVNSVEAVGASGAGTFNQSGGAQVVGSLPAFGGVIEIGSFSGSVGNYFLSGTGSLTVYGYEIVGDAGAGTFNQSSGSLTVIGTEVVGQHGSGTFIQSGGAQVVGSASEFDVIEIGSFSGSVGNYFLGGTGSLTVYGYNIVGDFGVGTFNQSGGTLTINGYEFVGNNNAGTVNQSDGTRTVNGNEYVGQFGVGTFNQSGGTLTVNFYEYVGNFGAGTFNQSGGSQTIGSLALGGGSSGKGTYLLSNTGSLTVNGFEYVGQFGAGTFNQSGGTQQVNGLEVVGLSGAGTFNQTGGTNWVVGELDISGGGMGTYSLSGGTLSATTVNVNAHGMLNFSGGTLSTTTLNLNAGGTLLFSGGTLSGGTSYIKRGFFSVPSGGNAQSSGTLNFQSPDNAGDPTAQTSIDGTLTHTGTLITDETFLGGAGTLVLTSTSTFRGSGELNVRVVNNSGTIAGDAGDLLLTSNTLNNTGTLKNLPGGSLFVRPASLANLGNVIVNAGGAVSFDPPLTNSNGHTISLLGGVLAAPSVTNSLGGAISGFGQITGDFINSGSVSFIGPTQIVGNFTNNAGGVVAVRNAQTLITGVSSNGGTITTSNGTIIFDGGIAPAPPLPAPPLDGPGGLDGTGTLLVNPGGHLISSYVRQSAVSISGTPGNTGIAIIRAQSDGGAFNSLDSLSISGSPGSFTGLLDLADNDAIVITTPLATIAGYIASGFNNGNWEGNGINSSIAALVAADLSNPRKTALGYAAASSIGVSTFDGQSVSGSSVLVRYTYIGDANLDGRVNALDFNALATNFGGASTFWFNGDFNYDGVANTQDFTLLGTNFGLALPAPALGSLVPEPSSMVFATILVLACRRRK